MHFTTILAVSASIFTLGLAVDPLSFTSWPADIAAGKPVTLTWTGAATNEPVVLTLRKGTSGNLQDVEVITDQGKDGTFTWTPGANIKEGETYAFQVTQDDQRNYSALLTAAAPANPMPADAAQTGPTSGITAAPTTGATSQATDASGTSSKALISSSFSGTPSSTPSAKPSTSISAEAPFATDDNVLNGKDASETGSVQSSASVSRYSVGVAASALAMFFYMF
ncbi:hypothetical protein N7466_003075 [Penicillium verhagenii]|uniref:uncharacterized protein n=1 Tax=Penicillium verhagenii TaxID=1562060 RepID=UPI0025458280|nr:uncharacterized protein N7466_003075 [Penicillium verhagenii]KAJ5936625.1 hypothetical protein N7466_003075 [Penicillium verhagenii]